MAGQQWPLPEPHKRWLLKSDLRKKELIESGLIKRWVSTPKLDNKPLTNKKWQLGPRPVVPMPVGIKCKPWYKDRDRLPPCYFSREKNKFVKHHPSLDRWRWVFPDEAMKDFRANCPTPEDVIPPNPPAVSLPMTSQKNPSPPPKKIHRQPLKASDLYIKLLPSQPAWKTFVEKTEGSLSKHPLMVYQRLKKALPPDLLLKVMKVLDPKRELEDMWACSGGIQERKKTPTHLSEEHLEVVNLEIPEAVDLEPPQDANLESPWKFNLEPAEAVKVEPPKKVNLKPAEKARVEWPKDSLRSYVFSLFPEEDTDAACTMDSPKDSVHQKPRRTVREIYKWMDANFGDMDIDEEYLRKKFEFDFGDPLTNNADEIKKSRLFPWNVSPSKQLGDINVWERRLRKSQDPYKPKQEKIRYGAWYVDPKCWGKLVNDKPLLNPKVVGDKEHGSHGRLLEPDNIDEHYGPTAFEDFIVKNGYKIPSVIVEMLLKKGWKYESVKAPIHLGMKVLSKPKEKDSKEVDD